MTSSSFHLFCQLCIKTQFCFIGLLGIVTHGNSQSTYPETYDGDSLLQSGSKHYDLGAYDKALADFDKIFKTDPQFYLAKYERMLTLTAMNLADQAHDELEEWYHSEYAFEVPEAMILYANSLTKMKKFDEAQKVFDQCIKVTPDSPILLYNIALMHYNKEDNAKCIEYLKKTLHLNPNHGVAHYFLGLVCLEEGKIVPGALALLGYLALVPAGEYAEDAVTKLNVKMSQSYLKNDSKVTFPADGDDFAELESILRDQLPLHPKYKLKCSVDEIFTRHAQAIFEYVGSHTIRNGFFEKTYLPWMKEVQAKNLTESATYYLIQIFKEQMKKSMASKQKEIDQFSNTFIANDFWPLFSTRRKLHFGKEQDVLVFIKEGHPNLFGTVINGKYEGRFKMVDKHGRTTGDLNFKDDMLEGKQVYFQQNGRISEETEYVKGLKNGVRTVYFENGQKSLTETYKDDAFDGPFITFYPNGSKNCEGSYVKSQLSGSYNCHHMDGSKRLECTFAHDKLHGSYKMYNPGGELVSSFEYINGELTGQGLEYHDGKTLISSGNYTNGKVTGAIKTFWENQTLKNQSLYENGKIKSYEEYFANGKLSETRSFNSKEELESVVYFDINGEKYYEEKYSSGNFKAGFQYLKDNPKPLEIKKSDFVVKYPGNITSHSGKFANDQMNGKWVYNYFNGNLSYELDYVKNQAEGLKKSYEKSGKLTTLTTMKQNKADGLNRIYENGSLTQVSYYKDDAQTGPYKVFRRDSSVRFEGYLIDNNNQYTLFNYSNSNRLMSASKYIDNIIYQTTSYDKDGTITKVDSFLHLNGTITKKSAYGMLTFIDNYKNGIKNGKSITKDAENIPVNEFNYINNELHGKCLYYNQTGTLSNESTFYHGKLHGESKYYDLSGTLRTVASYIYGVEYGTSSRYYQNGKPLYKYDAAADIKNGEYTFFNLDGHEVAALGYNMDYIEYYKVIDKSSGKLGSPVPVKRDASVSIESNYPDGKEAFRLQVDRSIWNKTLKITDKNGNSNYLCDYTDGKINGLRKEYYINGKPYKVERFAMGEYHGDQEFYDQSGNLTYSAKYKNDQMHGELKVYKNGKLVKTKTYDTDELTEIQNH